MAKEPTPTDDLQRQLAEAQRQLAEAQGRLKVYEHKENGYLLVTPNPAYNGVTAGVEFRNGVAFIPLDAKHPRFAPKVMNEGQLAKCSAAEKAAYKVEVSKSEAQRAAEWISKDFGYKVYSVSPEPQEAVMAEVREYHQANARMIEDAMARAKAEGLLAPAVL